MGHYLYTHYECVEFKCFKVYCKSKLHGWKLGISRSISKSMVKFKQHATRQIMIIHNPTWLIYTTLVILSCCKWVVCKLWVAMCGRVQSWLLLCVCVVHKLCARMHWEVIFNFIVSLCAFAMLRLPKISVHPHVN